MEDQTDEALNGEREVEPEDDSEMEDARYSQTEFSIEDTLSPDNFRRDIVEYYGYYSPQSWDHERMPKNILKIDFHGDGHFTDNFVRLLSEDPHMDFTHTQMVDLRGCGNLTDIGVMWLAQLLKDNKDIHTILLGGSHRLTSEGAASFQQLSSRPTLSLVGTGVTTLPDALWIETTQLQGCPLLSTNINDEKRTQVLMGKLVIHQEETSKYSLSSLLISKAKENTMPMKYFSSWKCGDTDYSVVEASMNHPSFRLLELGNGHHIVLSVDLETPSEKSLQHITDVVKYHIFDCKFVQKHFIIMTMIHESSDGDCTKELNQLQTRVIDHLTKVSEEQRAKIDSVKDRVNTSFCGDLVRTRLEVQNRNLEHFTREVQSMLTFTSINTDTMEGYDQFCTIIKKHQTTLMEAEPHLFNYTDAAKKTIEGILNISSTQKIVSRDDCCESWGLQENQVKEVFRLLHSWGKVILITDFDPWVVVLDVAWFVDLVLRLDTSLTDRLAGGKVRCLHPDTPVWDDNHSVTFAQQDVTDYAKIKVLLDVLVKSHHLMRLTCFRASRDDATSYLVNPRHLKYPSTPLSHFYNPDDPAADLFTVTATFTLPTGVEPDIRLAVLCEAARLNPPVLLAPTYLVDQLGAAQVVLAWYTPQDGSEELRLVVSTFLPQEESESQGIVAEYTFSVLHCFEDVISHTLLTAKIPFITSCEPDVRPANVSICSSHRWASVMGDQAVSVCTLCMNCSEQGVLCEYNQIPGPYSTHQCQCQPNILCCQDCGLCQTCAKFLWEIRSALRPCNLRTAVTGPLFFTNTMMTPAIFNEASVVKTKESEIEDAYSIGLLSEDGERFIQLFPGKALVGSKDQGYHRRTRRNVANNQVTVNPELAFDLGDQITIRMSEPRLPRLREMEWTPIKKNTDFDVNMLLKQNCSFSPATNIVRSKSRKSLGMVVSHLPASDQSLYFDAEIVSLTDDGFTGIGMTPTVHIEDCIGHGVGHSATGDCKMWSSERWQVGDVVGCGTWLDQEDQKVVFSHNDKVVCQHSVEEVGPLHAAVIVRPGEALRILRSEIWKHPKTIKDEAQSRMPTNQEIFESQDGTVRICPKNVLLFEKPMGSTKRPSSSIFIENNGQDYLLWKVRTNQQVNYISNPNKGIVRPGELSEIVNECKTSDREMDSDRFQIVFLTLQKYEVSDDILDVGKATELWNMKRYMGVKENAHVVSCQWKTDHMGYEQKETNFPEELDESSSLLIEPSYEVSIFKNGGLVSSYWLPKAGYRFAVETRMTTSSTSVIPDDLVFHLPKLPVKDSRDGFKVGMIVNVALDKRAGSEFTEEITSVCPNPSVVYAVCQVDKVESGDPDQLHLTFHGSLNREDTAKRISLQLPADSDRLQRVSCDISTSDNVSVYVDADNVVQLVGFIPNTCRRAPKHLFEIHRSYDTSEHYVETSCENLLFGAHMIYLWLEQQTSRNLPAFPGPACVFLPNQLSPSSLLYGSLQQLHDFSKMKICLVCKVVEHGDSQDWHLMDSEGYTPEGTITYSLLYRNLPVMYNYIDLASKMVRLPSYREIIDDNQIIPRYQVESLVLGMMRTYALTAQLLAIPRYMKVTNVDTELGRMWEPRSILPLDFEADTLCSTHSTESVMKVTDPFMELARNCCFVSEEGDSTASTNTRPPDCFTILAKDFQEYLPKMPWLKTILLEGDEAGPDIHLSLPELTEVVNTSSSTILIDDCPKLVSWEGSMMNNAEKQLELLTRCRTLERIILHGNSLKELPVSVGQLQLLTTLHLTESHLTKLPSSFTALRNLTDLRIIGSLAQWDKKSDLTLTKDILKRKFPFVPEETLSSVLRDVLPGWNGSELRIRTAEQCGKVFSVLHHIGPSFGKEEVGVHGGFPREILQLTNLQHLQLSYQAMRFLPPQISRLEKLQILELDGCLNLEFLPSTLGFLPLKRLSLENCISLRTPSREIVDRGTEAVTAYLKQMARGKSQNWRTKLMLVGIGGAGKTTLMRALRSSSAAATSTTKEEITHGIDIDSWTASDEQNRPGKKVTFSTWDFAGQTVFYNTHQFFLSDRAVYLLVWSTRQGFDNSGLEFWLSSIQCHSPDAPVFIIATHADWLTTDLPKGNLQKLYPQIKGFHYVGSTTGKGIPELKAAIVNAALDLDYMGEDVPTVYLDLEKKILSLRDKNNPYIKWSVVKEYSMEAGIFDEKDMVRAVQFLQHIGSVQYFDYEVLRNYVVINPQWIVDAMASVVTFKDSIIKNGRLYHKHVAQLWKEYPENLHEWLLCLTEMFDLTFQISKNLSLVPCLLSYEQPEQLRWPPGDDRQNLSLMMIVYTFRYLPTGLFNRLQARLFEFSNGKSVWKQGSVIEKTGQYAFLEHETDQKLVVQVVGDHPGNILFLIHETLEDLINSSYRGVQFEYLIPCPECVKAVGMDNPAMFEASMIREAAKCAAPYLQCRRFFHTVPMSQAKALMPPDDNQELDLQLQQSMESLGEMRNNLRTDVFVLFSIADLPSPQERETTVDPTMVVEKLKERFTCFFDENIDKANMQSLMVSMQEAKTLLVFISNNFVKDARCSQLLQYAYSTFGDRLCLVNLSPDYAWKQDTAGFILSQRVFVNMKKYDKDDFKEKMNQLEKQLREQLGHASDKAERKPQPLCFISYCWNNSQLANASRKLTKKEATACDPRSLKRRIEAEIGVPCWLDVEQTGKRGLFEDITEGLRAAEVVVAFVSNEYLKSANCMMELRFAISTLKVPTIFVAVGLGMEWQFEEIGTLQRHVNAQVVDMRCEVTDESVKTVQDFIQSHILTKAQRAEKHKKMKSMTNKMSIVDLANVSYHEEFELAQRKLMRRLTYLASHQSVIPYPRIFTLDFTDCDSKVSDSKPANKQRPDSGKRVLASPKSALMRRDSGLKQDRANESKICLDDPLCIRFLCEHDPGWHATSEVVELRGLTLKEKEVLLEKTASYLARMLNILKHSSVPLNCQRGEEEAAFERYIIKLAHEAQATDSSEKSYIELLQYTIGQDKDMKKGGLKKCVLTGGRTRWLCADHQKGYRVTVLTTDVSQRTNTQKEDTDYTKGITEGLRDLHDKQGHHQQATSAKNISDFISDLHLDALTPRTEGLLNTAQMMFETAQLHHEDPIDTIQETKEKVHKVRSGDENSQENLRRPPSALRSSSKDNQKTGALKRVSFSEVDVRNSVERRQAAQRRLQKIAQENKQKVKSKACVIQ